MATFFGAYIPAPYLPATTGNGGLEGALVAGAILLVVVAVAATLVLLNRPSRQMKAKEPPAELPKAA